MNRIKLNKIVALSLSVNAFVSVAYDPIVALATNNQETSVATCDTNYLKDLYTILQSKKSYNEITSSRYNLDTSLQTTNRNISSLFSQILSNETNVTEVSCTYDESSKIGTFHLPSTNCIYNSANMSITPDKDIEALIIKTPDKTYNYTNLDKDKSYILNDFTINSLKDSEVFIKYKENNSLVSQNFTVDSINNNFAISNFTIDYEVVNKEIFAKIGWTETSTNNNLNEDILTKLVSINDTKYKVQKLGNNSYSAKINVTNICEDATLKIQACDALYETTAITKTIKNPLNYSLENETVDTRQIVNKVLNINYPFKDNVEYVEVNGTKFTSSPIKLTNFSITKSSTYIFNVKLKDINKPISFNKTFSLNAINLHTNFTTKKFNYDTNKIEELKLKNGDSLSFDYSTLPNVKEEEFPIDIGANKDLSSVKIKVNNTEIKNDNLANTNTKNYSTTVQLNKNSTNLIYIEVKDKDKNTSSITFNVANDSSKYNLNTALLKENFEEATITSNIENNYSSNNVSKILVTSTLTNLTEDEFKAGKFSVTCTNEKTNEPLKNVFLNYSYVPSKGVVISGIENGKNTIGLTFIDRANHKYTKTLTIVKNNMPPSLSSNVNTYVGPNSSEAKGALINIKDTSLNPNELNIKQTSENIDLPEACTLYVSLISTDKSTPVDIDLSKANIKSNADGSTSVDLTNALKDKSVLIDGTYKLSYSYYNNILIKASSDLKDNSYKQFKVDSLAPTFNFSYKESEITRITENAKNFLIYNGSTTLSLNTLKDNLSAFNSNVININSNDNDIFSADLNITNLKSYGDELKDGITTTLNSINSTYTLCEEGYYKIKCTLKDRANNISYSKDIYVVISKSTPTLNYKFINESGILLDSNSTYSDEKLSPVVTVSSMDKSNANLTLKDEKNNKTYPLEETSSTRYGLKTYKINEANLKILSDGKYTLSSKISFASHDTIETSKTIFIESTSQNITSKLNNNDVNSNTIIHLNSEPTIEFKVNNAICYNTSNENSINDFVSFTVTNGDGEDCTRNFSLNKDKSNRDSSSKTNTYTISYTGKDLKKDNGNYTLSFKYTSLSGRVTTKDVHFVIDTEAPSYILNFYSSDKPISDIINSGDNINKLYDDELTVKADNKNKININTTDNKIYCGYNDIYLSVQLVDNSFDYNGVTGNDLSSMSLSLDGKEIARKTNEQLIKIDKSNFAENKVYSLSLSAKDKANNINILEKYDLLINRSEPKVSLQFNDINNNEAEAVFYNKSTGIAYFNKTVIPNLTIDAPLFNKDELIYDFTLNNASVNKENLNLTTLDNKKLTATMPNLDSGSYFIKTNVTNLAGITNSTVNTKYKYDNGIKVVVDSTAPTYKMYSSANEDLHDLNNYIGEECNLYIAINDPNLDEEAFINSFNLMYSNTIGDTNLLSGSKLTDVTIENITCTASQAIKDRVDANNTTTIYKISKGAKNLPSGYYSLSYTLIDYSKNTTNVNNELFTIDTTPIEVNDNNFNFDKHYYNSTLNMDLSVLSHISGFKDNIGNISLTQNDTDVTSKYVTNNFNNNTNGGNININIPLDDNNKESEGNYKLSIVLCDNAGKKYTKDFSFSMGRTGAILSDFKLNLGDGQVKDDTYYTNANDLNVTYKAIDSISGIESKTISINGTVIPNFEESIPNQYFLEDGKYNIKFDFVDKAGNISSYEKNVIVDKTAPSLSVDGFDGIIDREDGFLYINKNITPIINVNDLNGENTSKRVCLLDSLLYTSPIIKENGHHIYSVTVSDLAGNTTTKIIDFILDTIAPDINLSDIEDEKYYNTDIEPKFETSDPSATLVAYLNNTIYNGEPITTDGDYILKLICTDKAKNITEKTINFVRDTKSPIISIFGINENQVNGKVTPLITIDDVHATIEAFLNGENYYGGTIYESGKYTLLVKAVDKAGNVTERILTFLIDSNLPQISVCNLEENGTYLVGFQPNITIDKESTVDMILNDKEYNGEAIMEPGQYTLIINAVDSVANKNSATFNFTITTDPSVTNTTTVVKLEEDNEDTKANILSSPKNLVMLGITTALLLSAIITIFIKKINRRNNSEDTNELFV